MKSMRQTIKLNALSSNGFMMIVMLLYLLPLWYAINNGFKQKEFISIHPFTLSGQSFTFENIAQAFKLLHYPTALFNSAFILVLSCAMLVILGSLAAYGILLPNNKLMNNVYTVTVAFISIPVQIAIVPMVLALKQFHLINTFLGVALLYAGTLLPFVIFLYAGFMRTIPKELPESATIDGASSFRIYLQIYMPLLKTITGIILILRGVGIWNDLLIPLIVISKSSMYPLTLNLYVFANSKIGQWDIVFGGTVLVGLPITLFFIVFQKSFIKGIMAGSVKG
ncbi:carbohydrate ABC transporter permease [Paenibacillus psychroresistens]|uniref:Carbohydrate ABC transporter permease n=1 Tax=Paenibacillus psychroresistens TaxID=1778678 RepID=A0A6B8RGV7_9BACL|nr:carbohydrate ABC transporter permease [Paenibacillus psychroresistens]QGQ94772.1 carbohydrate ABC transporter permease [Paenibacillus psychroresistens]